MSLEWEPEWIDEIEGYCWRIVPPGYEYASQQEGDVGNMRISSGFRGLAYLYDNRKKHAAYATYESSDPDELKMVALTMIFEEMNRG